MPHLSPYTKLLGSCHSNRYFTITVIHTWIKARYLHALFVAVLSTFQLHDGLAQGLRGEPKDRPPRCGYSLLMEQMQKEPAAYQRYLENRRLNPITPGRMNLNPGQRVMLEDPETGDSLIRIPVVFHVMHHPDDTLIGWGSNISDEQIQAQMLALNYDFRRKVGTRGFNTHPSGSDVRIEFVLAGRDPSGASHKGINRFPYPLSNAHPYGSLGLKDLMRWPADRYLNIWVVGQITLGVLGYSYLPAMLLGDPDVLRKDGIVLGSRVVGSVDFKPGGKALNLHEIYAYGRTLTHEMGHYLDLYHTWGDGDCSVDDEVEDTPNCSGPSFGCPRNPAVECPPAPPRMVANYMDYSDDLCMNVFTLGQTARMRASLTSLYPWRGQLASLSNLIASGCADSTMPRVGSLARLGGISQVKVNDTLGREEWIRVKDVNGLGKDSVRLVLEPDASDVAGIRVITINPESDAFGYVRFRAVSGARPGWNRMTARVDESALGTGPQSPSLLLEWRSIAEASLYPNPFTEAVYLQWDGLDSVSFGWTLLDITGRRIQEGRYSGPAFWTPDVRLWQPQAYMLKLEWLTGEIEHRRIIKH